MADRWILRKGNKGRFRYVAPDGRAVDSETRERIELLRIPPAWRDVHIAASPRAAIQVWGFDARGRKQYRYHQRAVEKGTLRKFYRVRQMAKDLPALRRRFLRDLKRDGFPRERACAGVVLLISHAWFRIGSDRYEKENNSFGITTLRKSHIFPADHGMVFEYRGKRGIDHRQSVTEPMLIDFILSMLTTPGSRLFRYRDGRKWVDLNAREVNEYIEEVAGFPYTAKDFRTWGGSLRAATVLSDLGPARSKAVRSRNVVMAVRMVAAELGNTPAICRKSYVHPMIFTRYLRNGATIAVPSHGRTAASRHTPEESALIAFLDRHFPDRRSERRHE